MVQMDFLAVNLVRIMFTVWMFTFVAASRGISLYDSIAFLLILTSGRYGAQIWAPDRPDVKIMNHGLSQYGAELPFLRYHFGNFVH